MAKKMDIEDKSTLSRLIDKDGFGLCRRDAIYIIWKYAHDDMEDLPNTYDELKEKYKADFRGATEKFMRSVLRREEVNRAVMWLLKEVDRQRDIELLNLYYERAKTDTQALKAYVDFKKDFFGGDTSEIEKILSRSMVGEEDTGANYNMEV